MRIVKHPVSLNIKEHNILNLTNRPIRHSVLLPSCCRCIIVGPSNCGKTNLMVNLIEDKNGLCFENVYIYSKSLFQPLYRYLSKLLKSINGIGFYEYNENDEVISPTQVKCNSVFIFDDICFEKQKVIKEYFSMGRHKLIDVFYLTQSYANTSKHLVRENSNVLIVFKNDKKTLEHIYNDHVGCDMSFNAFLNICKLCWKNKYDFLVISKDNPLSNGRYRIGFDNFIQL